MAQLELLCAPAGTGKTHQCIEEFKQSLLGSRGGLTNQSWFILPTIEHAERINEVVLKDGRFQGFFRLNVTTINAFIQQWVSFISTPVVSDLVRSSLVNQILKEEKWTYWSPSTNLESLSSLLCDFLSELKSQNITAQDLKIQNPSPKLQDLAHFYNQYQARLQDMGAIDYDDQIQAFVRHIEDKKIIPPVLNQVWLDGFYDFSASQLSFIKILKSFARRIVVTLTLDNERSVLFHAPLETRQALEKIGFRTISSSQMVFHRTDSGALRAIEKNLFSTSPTLALPNHAIAMVEAIGENGEAESVAREILRLYKTGKYLWSDFCVILRRVGNYEATFRSVFSQFNIPVEIHERRKLKTSAFARSFLSLIRLFLGPWKREELFALLKFPSWRISQEEVFDLERQAEQQGVYEGREAWQTFLKPLTLSGPLRDVIRILYETEEKLKKQKKPNEFSLELKALVRNTRLFSDFTRRTDDVGREEAHAFSRFLVILDEIEMNFENDPGRVLTFDHYISLLLEGIESALFSVRHLDRNRVQVYDVSSARQKEYKIVFVSGLLEGVFPRQIREDAILKDDERVLLNQELQKSQVELRQRLPRTTVERYLFYLAVTRAKEHLILTTPRFDTEGREALVSFYMEEVKKLFSSPVNLVQDRLAEGVVALDRVRLKKELYAWVLAELFQKKPSLLGFSLYNQFHNEPLFQSILDSIFRQRQDAVIADGQIKEKLKSATNVFSPTGLETFAICPFRYFIQKTCQLEEKREPTDVMALGTILHEALEHFYTETTPNKTKEEWLDFLDTHEARKKLSGFVQAALAHEKFKSEIPYRKRLVAESLTEILYTLLKKEKETERKRLTSPQFFELSFGSGHKNNPQSLPALQIDNPEGEPILIRGTIDRVDVDLQSKVALVIDYKRTKTFDISEIQQGIHLQLPLYVLVLRDLLGLEPAGAELYSLKKGQRSGLYVQELKEKLGKITSLKGSVSQEEFNRILEEAKTLVRQCVNRIREGEIQIDSKNCDLCSCDHICRFEKWKLAYKKETRDR